MMIQIMRNTGVLAVRTFILSASAATLLSTATSAQELGQVRFETTCTVDANEQFNSGLTLLHHMMYSQAAQAFAQGSDKWPDCAMLHWGHAMSYIHPLWPGQPSEEDILAGRASLEAIGGFDSVSEIEHSLIEAANAFYNADDMAYRDRLASWADGQAEAFENHSDNVDVAAIYGLSQLAIAPRGDPTMAEQRRVGALLEALNDKGEFHPGVYHYLIHAYDNPVLFELGLPFAEGYGKIAPEVPHALHMPSHIFVRQGQWDDVIVWNTRSAEAALAQPLGDVISSHYAHAMDYRIYGHIQRGEFEIAEQLVAEFLSVETQQSNFGSAYGLAASPVRILLEQEKWEEAAAISTTLHPAIAWDKFPQAFSMVWFAKGLGAARSGDAEGANAALGQLQTILDRLNEAKQGYWANLTDSQMNSIRAWLAVSEGTPEIALALQIEAADTEDAGGKSPVTPGHVLPARELLGDMYLELGMPDLAREAYAATIASSPNRWRSVQALN